MTLADRVVAEINRRHHLGRKSVDQLGDEMLALCAILEPILCRFEPAEDGATRP